MHYVYLHGFCSGPLSAKGSFFKSKFQQINQILHLPDLNQPDFEHLTLSSQLLFLKEFTKKLKGDLTLIGSSLGGYLAALMAQRESRIKKTVLIAPAFRFISRQIEKMGADELDKWKNTGYIEVYHYSYRENRKLHYQIVEDARQYDNTDINRQIPAQVFHGLRDESVPYALSLDYVSANPKAHLILLNSNHQLLDAKEMMWNYIRQFLNL